MNKILLTIIFIASLATMGETKPRYVTTIHPLAEILRELVGEWGEVIRLMPPGASPHTYEPRPSDARLSAGAAALFYVAPHLDGWAAKLDAPRKYAVMDCVPESLRLPFEAHEHERESHGHEPDETWDPHFWTDPLTVKETLPGLVRILSTIDADGASEYQINAKRFATQLDDLHAKMEQCLSPIKGESVMLFHPSMCYLVKRYGLIMAGTIESAPGKEPSPWYLIELTREIKREGVKAVFTEPQLSDKSAKSLAEAAGVKVYELDPIGGTGNRIKYGELLLYNAGILKAALQ